MQTEVAICTTLTKMMGVFGYDYEVVFFNEDQTTQKLNYKGLL